MIGDCKEQVAMGLMDDALCKPIGLKVLAEKVAKWGRVGRNTTGGEMQRFLDSISGGVGGAKVDYVAKL